MSTKIKIHRYDEPTEAGFDGYVEPDCRSWSVFFGPDGVAVFYGQRDETGAVIQGSMAKSAPKVAMSSPRG